MAKGDNEIPRGLPSVHEARRDRKRQRFMPPRFWLWAGLIIGAAILVWWRVDEGQIQSMRSELLTKQRVVAKELGGRWFTLRDKVETWTAECAAEEFTPQADPAMAKTWDFRDMPGIYLRLSREATSTPKSIREAAKKSLHDGFTSCLMRVPNGSPLTGARCENIADCAKGQLCNEFNLCAAHTQPYNLRIAYKSLYVLSDQWVADIQAIGNKITIRGATATFEAVSKYELPVAADLLSEAKYFMVVVDEPAENVSPDDVAHTLPEVADAGTANDRAIDTAPHKARVCVWRLEDDKRMLALRGDAAGALVGGPPNMDVSTRIARQRQANSCALALTVREAMGAQAGVMAP